MDELYACTWIKEEVGTIRKRQGEAFCIFYQTMTREEKQHRKVGFKFCFSGNVFNYLAQSFNNVRFIRLFLQTNKADMAEGLSNATVQTQLTELAEPALCPDLDDDFF